MKQILFSIAALLCLAACNSKPDTPATTTGAGKNVEETSCYTSTSPKDTVQLHLRRKGNEVTGSLMYSIFEKDKNTGTITGQFYGDTLLATYTFMSEGVESEREVAFLKRGNELLEGYGEAAEQDGKMVFRNSKTLKYGNGIILTKTSCP